MARNRLRTIVALPPLMLRATEAAAACGMSRESWDRAVRSGAAPAPREVAGVRVWSVADLHEWIGSGCPHRDAQRQEVAHVG